MLDTARISFSPVNFYDYAATKKEGYEISFVTLYFYGGPPRSRTEHQRIMSPY